jgi:medium-chain acyl-[acyl-carrier-protein] hydrolase
LGTQWIITPLPNPKAAVRFICVPHAGGGVASFRGWSERLTAAEVGIVLLPGRGSRLREPLHQSISEAACAVADAVASGPERPAVFFGHSLGALIAFEAARLLESRSWPLLSVFVSGRRAPALSDPLPPVSSLPDAQFIAEVQRRYDSVPAAVLADADLMQLLLPGLRADFAMVDSYRHEPAAPLRCPLVACGGNTDPYATRQELEAWKSETTGRFSAHTFGGGHLYLQREQEALTALVANQLSVMVGAMSRCAAIRS